VPAKRRAPFLRDSLDFVPVPVDKECVERVNLRAVRDEYGNARRNLVGPLHILGAVSRLHDTVGNLDGDGRKGIIAVFVRLCPDAAEES
jgi:hypothetical protein